jgi:hypothetical protein
MSGLVSALETLKGSALTADEIKMLEEFQRQFSIADDDPINVVLAMMVRSQLILNSAPDLLQQKVNETIELHRTNLREQAIISAKELISDLSAALIAQQQDLSARWRTRAIWYCAGMGTSGAIVLMAYCYRAFWSH